MVLKFVNKNDIRLLTCNNLYLAKLKSKAPDYNNLGRKVNNAPGANSRRNFASVGTLSFSPRVTTWLEPAIQSKTSTWAAVNFKKHATSMSSKPEPAIWQRDTGQRIPCFDSCQLTVTWKSNIKDVRCKPRLHASVDLLAGVWPPCCATSSSSPSCVRAHEQFR